MTTESAPELVQSAAEPRRPAERPSPEAVGPLTAIDLLFDEARETVDEQILLARAYAAAAGITARTIALAGITAVLTLLVALLVAAVGAMLALAPTVGIVGATAIVTAVLLACAGVCGWVIRGAVRRFQHAARGGDQP